MLSLLLVNFNCIKALVRTSSTRILNKNSRLEMNPSGGSFSGRKE